MSQTSADRRSQTSVDRRSQKSADRRSQTSLDTDHVPDKLHAFDPHSIKECEFHFSPNNLYISEMHQNKYSNDFTAKTIKDSSYSHISYGEKVAQKVYQLSKESDLLGFVGESSVYSAVSHPNILSGRAIKFSEDVACVSMDRGECHLFQYAHKFPYSSRLQLWREIMKQLVDAVCYLYQSHGIVHADIKPENVVIVDGVVKLMDFGQCQRVSAQNHSISAYCTDWYCNKEDPVIDSKCDVYSIACTVISFLIKYHCENPKEWIYYFDENYANTALLGSSRDYVFIRAMLSSHEHRPSITEVASYFNGVEKIHYAPALPVHEKYQIIPGIEKALNLGPTMFTGKNRKLYVRAVRVFVYKLETIFDRQICDDATNSRIVIGTYPDAITTTKVRLLTSIILGKLILHSYEHKRGSSSIFYASALYNQIMSVDNKYDSKNIILNPILLFYACYYICSNSSGTPMVHGNAFDISYSELIEYVTIVLKLTRGVVFRTQLCQDHIYFLSTTNETSINELYVGSEVPTPLVV